MYRLDAHGLTTHRPLGCGDEKIQIADTDFLSKLIFRCVKLHMTGYVL